ncbi:hypothetical protein IFR09_05210 [Pseudomonas syringae]|nr:hypothetical protein [Pseudomonas syringae]MBD8791791.1 hypothetical protein [Pseudomonas syringae]MBD8801151.1 hypothetical protein [Pseudomonas syringae]MBD8810555.1 hypothetical protein [Pseudomonas syringae]
MIERLEQILAGGLEATDTSKRYYTFTLRNLERYRGVGIGDEVTAQAISRDMWNNLYVATLEDFRFQDDPTLLYTTDALAAFERKVEEVLQRQGLASLDVKTLIRDQPLDDALAILALEFNYPDIDRNYSLYRSEVVLSGELMSVYQRLIDSGVLLEKGCSISEKGPIWKAPTLMS